MLSVYELSLIQPIRVPHQSEEVGENYSPALSFSFAKQFQWRALSTTAVSVVGLGAVGGACSLAVELLAKRYGLGVFATQALSTMGDELGTGTVLAKLGNGDIENNIFQGLTSSALINGLMMAGMGLMLPLPLQMIMMVGSMTVGNQVSSWLSYQVGLTTVNPLEETTTDTLLADFTSTALGALISQLIPVGKIIGTMALPMAMARKNSQDILFAREGLAPLNYAEKKATLEYIISNKESLGAEGLREDFISDYIKNDLKKIEPLTLSLLNTVLPRCSSLGVKINHLCDESDSRESEHTSFVEVLKSTNITLPKYGSEQEPLAVQRVNEDFSAQSSVYKISVDSKNYYFRPVVPLVEGELARPFAARRTLAASKLNEALGLNTFAKTWMGRVNGVVGSLSEEVAGKPVGNQALDFSKYDDGLIAQLQMFEYLIGNIDNHGFNVYAGESNLATFDADCAFEVLLPLPYSQFRSRAGLLAQYYFGFLLPDKYSAKLMTKLEELSPEIMRRDFSGLLTPKELNGLILRREILLEHYRPGF